MKSLIALNFGVTVETRTLLSRDIAVLLAVHLKLVPNVRSKC